MSSKFAGKTAVITGASTAMGLATAKRFVEEGMDLVSTRGRRKDALDAAAAEIGKNVTFTDQRIYRESKGRFNVLFGKGMFSKRDIGELPERRESPPFRRRHHLEA